MPHRIDHQQHIAQAQEVCRNWEPVAERLKGFRHALKLIQKAMKEKGGQFVLDDASKLLDYLSAHIGRVTYLLVAMEELPHSTGADVAREVIRAGRHLISQIPEERRDHHPTPETIVALEMLGEIVEKRGERFTIKDARADMSLFGAKLEMLKRDLKPLR